VSSRRRGSALAGANRPQIVATGTSVASASPGRTPREDDAAVSTSMSPRATSEKAAALIAADGINDPVLHFPGFALQSHRAS
jgi:hypothetical protein